MTTDAIMALTRGDQVVAVLIDSNVLLDLMTEDPDWFAWSAEAVARGAYGSGVVINTVVYAEVSVRYSSIEDLEDALPKAMIDREAIPDEAGFLAGKAFLNDRRRGGDKRSPPTTGTASYRFPKTHRRPYSTDRHAICESCQRG